VPRLRQRPGATPSTALTLLPRHCASPATDRVIQAPTSRMLQPHRSATSSLRAAAAPLRSYPQCLRARRACLAAVERGRPAVLRLRRCTTPQAAISAVFPSTRVSQSRSIMRPPLAWPPMPPGCLSCGVAVELRCRSSAAQRHRSGVALPPKYLYSNCMYQLILMEITTTCHRVIRGNRYLLCKLRFCLYLCCGLGGQREE